MKNILFAFGIAFLGIVNAANATCPEGNEKTCTINGKPGHQTCGHWGYGACVPDDEAPATPSPTAAPPTPCPSVLQKRPILETDFQNPTHAVPSVDWASSVCDGGTFPFDSRLEWTPAICKTDENVTVLTGVSGTVVLPSFATCYGHYSNGDVPFTHPFGFDWEYFIALDDSFRDLLGPGNTTHPNYVQAINHAKKLLGVDRNVSILGVEIDKGLVPNDYRVMDGDRVVTFGRWVVDCGHEDYHTELHPPTLVAVGRAANALTTHVKLFMPPFVVSQEFNGKSFIEQAIDEALKVSGVTNFLGVPSSTQMEIKPTLLPPFNGVLTMSFLVRPPGNRRTANDVIKASYFLGLRPGARVSMRTDGSGAVRVTITLNEREYYGVPKPEPRVRVWHSQELRQIDDYGKYLDWAQWGILYLQAGKHLIPLLDLIPGNEITGVLSSWFFSNGVETLEYDPISVSLTENVDPCVVDRVRWAALGSKLLAKTGGIPGSKADHLLDELERRQEQWRNSPDGQAYLRLKAKLDSAECRRSTSPISFVASDTPVELREVEVRPELNWPLIGWIDVAWTARPAPTPTR